jgi:phenylalanyl-tRNA synthetase beta chain
MNILASFDWLKEYLALKETPEQFAARVSLSGPGVERLYPQGQELEGIVLGLVREVNPHPNADKLRVAKVDAGSALSIVCGGSNLAVGQWVAVAKVGAKVKWHGEGELVELKPTEIRGVASEGMICAANEIGLFDAFPHAEREILVLNDALELNALKAGSPLADVLGLAGDVVMDIEVTTNRPDAAGMVGLAREAAAILKRPFTWKPAAKIPASKAKFAVTVADKKLCPRYLAVKLGGIKVGPSPWWLKRRLLSAGLRPVNNVVDITNFVMLELGHPIHAFDAEKLAGEAIEVRRARAGESMAALDGKTYTFDDSTLVIADAEKPVAVAGIMGGEHSGVTGATTSLVFEAATFDPVSVRRSARKLNLYSDAQLRFEKGLSTEAPALALVRAVELCLELAGGEFGWGGTSAKR